MIINHFIFSIFITLLPACSNDYAIKYYGILDGDHDSVIFRFDNLRRFKEEIKPEKTNQLRFIYKVLMRNNQPIYAEYFNSTGNISSTYTFNSQGRIIKHKYLTKGSDFNTCLTNFNEQKKVKVYQCYNKNGQQIERLITVYKNNLNFKTTSFDSEGKVISYFIFNYEIKKILEFSINHKLIRTIDIAEHF